MNSRTKFGVPENADSTAVKAHWQKVALEHHTDHGGNVKDFMRMQKLYKKALKESEVCNVCRGTKKLKK